MTFRSCSRGKGIAHRLCSNMYLFDKNVEFASKSIQFCSPACADASLKDKATLNQNCTALQSWSIEDDAFENTCKSRDDNQNAPRETYLCNMIPRSCGAFVRSSYTIAFKQVLNYLQKFQNSHEGYEAVQKNILNVPVSTLKSGK